MKRSIRKAIPALVLTMAVLVGSVPASAHEPHDPQTSGHPVRVAAYLLHPFGLLFDTLFLRPAHWIGNQEPFKTIFGHTEER